MAHCTYLLLQYGLCWTQAFRRESQIWYILGRGCLNDGFPIKGLDFWAQISFPSRQHSRCVVTCCWNNCVPCYFTEGGFLKTYIWFPWFPHMHLSLCFCCNKSQHDCLPSPVILLVNCQTWCAAGDPMNICLVPDFNGKSYSFSPLSIALAEDFS